MKAIIYYSLSGHTKKALEERFQGDFFRLKGKIKIPKRYFFQLAYLGMFSSFNAKLAYEPFEIDFDKYNEIVLGSPVWAWTICPFMKKFLKHNKFKNKKVTLLLTNEGGPGKAMEHYKKYLDPSNEIVDEISLVLGLDYEKSTIIKR
jgi:flavodoxin